MLTRRSLFAAIAGAFAAPITPPAVPATKSVATYIGPYPIYVGDPIVTGQNWVETRLYQINEIPVMMFRNLPGDPFP